MGVLLLDFEDPALDDFFGDFFPDLDECGDDKTEPLDFPDDFDELDFGDDCDLFDFLEDLDPCDLLR